jgi:plasmid maintenance system antidote protein VapI
MIEEIVFNSQQEVWYWLSEPNKNNKCIWKSTVGLDGHYIIGFKKGKLWNYTMDEECNLCVDSYKDWVKHKEPNTLEEIKDKSSKPIHPGEIIRVDYFYNSSKSLEEFSRDICIKQKRLIKIMEGEKNLKLKDSYKLSEAFNTTVDLWEGLQKEYSSHKGTEYLLSSPANAKHLMESIKQLKKGELVEQRTI